MNPTRRALCSSLALAALPLGLPAAARERPRHRAAPPTRLPTAVASALAQARIPASACSFVVQALDEARPSLAFNPAQAMNPASVMKLVPTYVALNMLGPSYRWKTPVYAVGPLKDGVLSGDLAFVGSGDPHLMADNLWTLALRLRDLGLRKLDGNVLVDRSAFDLPPHDPGGFDGDVLAPYNVGPDAFLVNFKAMRLGFQPAAQGGAVDVTVEPPMAGYAVRHAPRLDQGACGAWKDRLDADFKQPFAPSFDGRYAAACGDQTWNIAAPMPADTFVQGMLAALFAQVGIQWNGQVVAGRLPASATLLTTWDSPPLAVVVRDINKYSNNVMAQQVFLTLALQTYGPPADFAKAAQAATQWLDTHGLPMPGLVLDNGCGLSRIARISADDINRLLRAAWASPVMPEFIASLPLTGEDGTLKRRFDGSPEAGLVHAKTGSLRNVLSLAGYVQSPDGRRSTVVALINDPRAAGGWGAVEALLDVALRTA
ncbi:D-alanyl-D-alanine carboxypeptidase DacB precursor [mine drainage metagenome]|uniref:D-alanyl-D-alanine carboxypeptidase DacB n=1 Tax=mine drainage metagenome TaxID=410659 RepID=A0A1J5QFW3_9ZZZZ